MTSERTLQGRYPPTPEEIRYHIANSRRLRAAYIASGARQLTAGVGHVVRSAFQHLAAWPRDLAGRFTHS